jgi:excisionase family DNA binding protein
MGQALEPDGRPSEPVLLTVIEAAGVLGIGRTTAYGLIREGAWPTPIVRLGKLIKIPASPLRRFVETGCAQTPNVA